MKIIYGIQGRQNIFPYHALGQLYRVPLRWYYSNSRPFRITHRILAGAVLLQLYLAITRKADLAYTPYTMVHHQLDHKFAHWLDDLRYPPNKEEVEKFKKEQGIKN
ncbi:unnamed protein product [Didymodactylos carnosus]|uniref:Uncharacterized protein n=1 Tax=Didymodactylos carnosus TaxID=1234261 RepID=A0A813QGC6_9BILA|nr:unnamed protein product [Didymodactylos carnosus]CAF0949531.1 unnamed protein product [Didymodactylos carnosus]CAF3549074.1 unnamed protein product [Didymodactylos carnosus]CAF3723952.1 unnamed protein product [Didymodactylos carnosus]